MAKLLSLLLISVDFTEKIDSFWEIIQMNLLESCQKEYLKITITSWIISKEPQEWEEYNESKINSVAGSKGRYGLK